MNKSPLRPPASHPWRKSSLSNNPRHIQMRQYKRAHQKMGIGSDIDSNLTKSLDTLSDLAGVISDNKL